MNIYILLCKQTKPRRPRKISKLKKYIKYKISFSKSKASGLVDFEHWCCSKQNNLKQGGHHQICIVGLQVFIEPCINLNQKKHAPIYVEIRQVTVQYVIMVHQNTLRYTTIHYDTLQYVVIMDYNELKYIAIHCHMIS